jgi:hypothetical protein
LTATRGFCEPQRTEPKTADIRTFLTAFLSRVQRDTAWKRVTYAVGFTHAASKIQTELIQGWLYSLLSLHTSLATCGKSTVNQEDREYLLLEIAARFSRHGEVQAVYCQQYRDEIQIIVPIDTPSFSVDILDRLLDDEYEVRMKANDIILSFSYPALGATCRMEVVHPTARLLYVR